MGESFLFSCYHLAHKETVIAMNHRFWKNQSLFFIMSYAFTWLFWVPRALASQGYFHLPVDAMVFHILGAFGPAFAAVCLTLITDGKPALQKLLARYRTWRIDWKWYAFVLLTRPLIWLTALMGYLTLGQQTPAWTSANVGFVVLYLLSQLIVVGIGEELGWAGYALPRLQSRHGFLKANLILGVLWGVWHLPFFFTIGDSQYGTSILVFVLKLTAFRFLFSLAYTQTQSLLMPGLFHVSFNVLTEQIPLSPNDPWAIALSVLCTVLVMIVAGKKGWLVPIQLPLHTHQKPCPSG